MGRVWDDILTERDKKVFAKAGYGRRAGFGNKAAILVIDVNYDFVGDKPEPILDSIAKFSNSCGEEGWQGVYSLQDLLSVARRKAVPIIYTTGGGRDNAVGKGGWWRKTSHSMNRSELSRQIGNNIVAEIAPRDDDLVIYKDKPSAFFGTPLVSYLNVMGVDTLLMTGCTTSGCVRASVIDAFSYNYRVVVVEECTFDRGQASHKINLFDINAKYADVLPLAEVKSYLESLA